MTICKKCITVIHNDVHYHIIMHVHEQERLVLSYYPSTKDEVDIQEWLYCKEVIDF